MEEVILQILDENGDPVCGHIYRAPDAESLAQSLAQETRPYVIVSSIDDIITVEIPVGE